MDIRTSLQVLRGTLVNAACVRVAFVGALLASLSNVASTNTDVTLFTRMFFAMTVLVLVGAVTNVAKTVRDATLADALPHSEMAGQVRGSLGARIVNGVIAVAAVGLMLFMPSERPGTYGVDEDEDVSDVAFFRLSLWFLLQTTLNFTKMARDSFDADWFEQRVRALDAGGYVGGSSSSSHEQLRAAAAGIAAGTLAFKVLNTCGTLLAFGSTLFGVVSNETLTLERKLVFTSTLLFVAYCVLQVSKLVRDTTSSTAQRPRACYAAATVGGLVLSTLLHAAGLAWMPLTRSQLWFCCLGTFCVMVSVLASAKAVRDDEDRTAAEEAHTHHD